MKNKFLVVASAALVAMMSFVPVFADDIVVTGGTNSLDPGAITLPVTLTGLDQVGIDSTSTEAWTLTNAAGSGAAYHFTVSADVPTNGAYTIPLEGFRMTVGTITVVEGNTAPVTEITNEALTELGVPLLSAIAGNGMGTYTFLPTLELDVPAETRAGTYVTTIEVTLVAGPVL